MAVRTDIVIDWYSSPRIILVESPSVEISMQDLVDTCRNLEADLNALDNDFILSAAGKENLGGGVYVGITVTLNNAKLKFEDRLGPTWVRCDVYGGNLVAIDENGDDMDSIEPSSYVTVTRTSSSSATLQELSAIQYASFNDAVWIDADSSYTGTTYPNGTPRQPVNNLADALAIAVERGFTHLMLLSAFTFGATDNVDGYKIECPAPSDVITFVTGCSTEKTALKYCVVQGSFSGTVSLRDCICGDIDYVEGAFATCVLAGTIMLSGSNDTNFYDCWDGSPIDDYPTIDCGGSGRNLGVWGYNGSIKITNKTGSETANIGLVAGKVELSSTCTGGIIYLAGQGILTDNSNGATINKEALINQNLISDAVWDQTEALKYRIESLKSSHFAFGNTYYWDVENGSDLNDGLTDDTPVKTYTAAEALCTDHNNDAIFLLPASGYITDPIVISKESVHLICGGMSSAKWYTPGEDAITVSGNLSNVSIHNFYAYQCSRGVVVMSGCINVLLDHFDVTQCDSDGVIYYGNTSPSIRRGRSHANGSSGFRFIDTTGGVLDEVFSAVNTNDGVTLVNSDSFDFGYGCSFTYNYGYGIGATGSDISAIIDDDVTLDGNGLGRYSGLSIAAWGGLDRIKSYDGKVYINTTNGYEYTAYPTGTRSYPAKTFVLANLIANEHSLDEFVVIGNSIVTIDDDYSGKKFSCDSGDGGTIIVTSAADMDRSKINTLVVTGDFNGKNTTFEDCMLMNVEGFNGWNQDCIISGWIHPSAGFTYCNNFSNSFVVDASGPSRVMLFERTVGAVTISGMDNSDSYITVGFQGFGGTVTIDESCTAGMIVVNGYVTVNDYSTGTTVVAGQLVTGMVDAVFDEPLSNHTTDGTLGAEIALLKDTQWNKKVLTKISDTEYKEELYNDAGTVVIRTHTITKSGDVETRQ